MYPQDKTLFTSTPTWLGQVPKSIVMSMGDFGNVRANFNADIFTTKTGPVVKIFSCKLELFGSDIEFLHRLTEEAKRFVEEDYLSSVNKCHT